MKVEANKEYSFDDDQFLYKYLDLHKLIYFLNTQNLFFSPLIYFDDPLEGISQKMLLESREHTEANNVDKDKNPLLTDDDTRKYYSNYLEKVQRRLFASCWFLGVRESLAMWENYSNNDSVAIRFKPDDLCNNMIKRFSKVDEKDFSVMVHGKVEYFKITPLDQTDTTLKDCGHRYDGFIKDLSYKHEEEFRFLLIQNHQDGINEHYEFCLGSLKELDFTIITHPYMEKWKYKNIFTVLKNNGLEDKLQKSEIPTRRQIFGGH